jgi:hypothetical protein
MIKTDIQMDLQDMGFEDGEWVHMPRDRNWNMATEIQIL